MTEPVNAKGRPFSWSFSALNNFETCAFQYAHNRFYCTVPWVDTQPIIWGNRVHGVAELELKRMPHNDPEAFEQIKRFTEVMLRSGWHVIAEQEIAFTRDFKRVKWFSKDAWFRIKIDVTLTDRLVTEAYIYDWKTGKTIKDDPDQLNLSGAALSGIHPTIQEFGGKFIWTKYQEVTGIKSFTKADVPKIWEGFLARVARMEEAWRTEIFLPRPSGLCKKWCQVTACTHCGMR